MGSNEERARQALQELLDVSPQVEAAVIARRDGEAIASSLPPGGDRDDRLARLGMQVLEQAERSRVELGREPVVQCEVATGTGNVFVVADATNLVIAVTCVEPTVGLVFYDLKTALRTLREAASSAGNGSDPARNGRARSGS